MADLNDPANNPITGDGAYDWKCPESGRYVLALGHGRLDDPSDASSEDFEDADATLDLGNYTVEDPDGNAVSAVTAAFIFTMWIPRGATLRLTIANTTSACRLTWQALLVD